MRNPLLDLDFLRALDLQSEKRIFAKIILLDFQEAPVYEIQGRVSSGSVNIDGASAIRRTCSLSLVTQEKKIDNMYWGLHNKFKLEVGVENLINSEYPNIIWFKQGLFVITQLNESINSNSYTISLSGKDKGCLLNGEVGGTLPASIDFGRFDYQEKVGSEIVQYKEDVPIVDIIKNAMIVYGQELPQNIIINDVDNYGVELLEYRGDNNSPLYMLFHINSQTVTNMTFNGNQQYFKNPTGNTKIALNDKSIRYDSLSTTITEPTIVYANSSNSNEREKYTVVKITYGNTVGYRKTELTFPGELIAKAGETLASVLDKIKQTFNDFEYFYDIDGRFIFQKKQTYVNTSWNTFTVNEEELYAQSAALTSKFTYSFEDDTLLTAFSNSPNINNLRNDYAVWGARKNVGGGKDIPIHTRYAIERKPQFYRSITVTRDEAKKFEYMQPQQSKAYCLYDIKDNKKVVKKEIEHLLLPNDTIVFCDDWREIMYQMAVDYTRYNIYLKDFLIRVRETNPITCPAGITGYEVFYNDMQGHWRDIYDPNGGEDFEKYRPWHQNVQEAPYLLKFWIDFMDIDDTELGQYAISSVGHRPKAVNESKVTAIYYKGTPKVLFMSSQEYNKLLNSNMRDFYTLSGYKFIQLDEAYEKYFTISSQGISAQDKLDELLFQHTYCVDNITLTTVPIYYLEPNSRIYVYNNKTGISGEYIISKITIPLTYNGTSSISAQRAAQRIY